MADMGATKMVEVSNSEPVAYVYIHRDGRALWGTKSKTFQEAAAKAMRMDVPLGGHVEEVFDEVQ